MRDFEEDLESVFGEKIKTSDEFCKSLWSALANIDWINEDGTEFGCTFRYAGAIIADIRETGSYMDWYCRGEYATVSDEIANELKKLGWTYKKCGI